MKTLNLRLLLAFCLSVLALQSSAQTQPYSTRQLACGLSQPWEIKFGPDGYLWVTEAHSYQVSRIDPGTGSTEMMLDLSTKKDFPNFGAAPTFPQGGLQGFAFHPNFPTSPYFYVAYVRHFDSCAAGTGGCFFKTRIARYDYNMATKAFTNETIITDTIPGSSDHNGGRLVIGPVGSTGTNYLFYSVGDMGAGHQGNGSRPHHGQQPEYWEGKVLRFNLTPDTDPGANAWIPDNNPFTITTTQNAVWSLGHRNPQGLVFAPDGTLYESEHGPYSDDEVNIIQPGTNYGFPLIMGYTDGNYDGSKAGAGPAVPLVVSEAANSTAIQTVYPYRDPIFSMFPATKSEVSTIYNNDLNNTPPYANYFLQWPTSAPSGIDYYGSNSIAGWNPSLLVANLKVGTVYRLKLAANGQSVVGDTIPLFQGLGRFRDLAISPDGSKIYVAADSVGPLKAAPGVMGVPINRGCILEFNFAPAGVSAAQVDEIRIYPNPASGSFTIQLPPGITSADLTISNVLGATAHVAHITGSKVSISTAHLPPGIYTVKAVSDGSAWSNKLVVK
jgi:PQQ-dependent dehydrogenase (s-GDH family)